MKRSYGLLAALLVLLAVPTFAGERGTMVSLEVRIPSEDMSLQAKTSAGGEVSITFGENGRSLLLRPTADGSSAEIEVYRSEGKEADMAPEWVNRLVLAVDETGQVKLDDTEIEIQLLKIEDCADDCG